MNEITEERRLREQGVLQAKLSPKEQPQAPPSTPQEAAVSQDPAIHDIQPSAPSPTSSVPSSVPNLESIPAATEYDSDCKITGHIQPRKKRVIVKPEPLDPEIQKIELGAQNLLL